MLKTNLCGSSICAIRKMTWWIAVGKHLRNRQDVNSVRCPKLTLASRCTTQNGHPRNTGSPRNMSVAISGDPTCSALRDELKRPIVIPELKIAPDVTFLIVNIGSDSPEIGVAGSEKREGVMHVTGMAPRIPPPSAVANTKYSLIIDEVSRGLMKGIHSVETQFGPWNICSCGW